MQHVGPYAHSLCDNIDLTGYSGLQSGHHSVHWLEQIFMQQATTHLADHAIGNGLGRHIGHCARGLCGDPALDVHLARQAKVRHLGCKSVGHCRGGCQQDVAYTGDITITLKLMGWH